MALELFNPFEELIFNDTVCFLSGEQIESGEVLQVFPDWVLDQYGYRGKTFTMMDNITHVLYEDLLIPCSSKVKTAFEELDQKIKAAFDKGYDAVVALPEEKLFVWIARIVYGVYYRDMMQERQKQEKMNQKFNISAALKERFGLFHLMLQSLIAPVEFKGRCPWSISIVRLKYSKDIFHYRDNTIHLMFSLGMNGFGILACLQNNGVVADDQKDILDKIGQTVMHPIQFEELCARFLYYNFLLQYKPKYNIDRSDEKITIEALPMVEDAGRPMYGLWKDDVFAKVLTDYWTPWGLQKTQIHDFPNSPISFLQNEFTYEYINPESISLPF
ncbi:MAG TPA: hypothetical protein PKX92_07170 [Edaphocola sp.]|nr:hypothetical protein [Edaphocola sp.]